jgi:hypothetical protein
MRVLLRFAFFAVAGLASCSRADPPTADSGASASSAPLAPSLAALPTVAPSASASASAAAAASASAAAAPVDPGKLPQTQDKPDAQGPAFEARVAALWDAIVHDAPERAMPFFFPADAYAQIKDIPNPKADWNARLIGAYKRDIHSMHARLGANADSATLVKLEVPSEKARWVNPHEELNTGGYWRVYGSKLKYEIDGKEKSLDITSLISWRGEWYVVHLIGFK